MAMTFSLLSGPWGFVRGQTWGLGTRLYLCTRACRAPPHHQGRGRGTGCSQPGAVVSAESSSFAINVVSK